MERGRGILLAGTFCAGAWGWAVGLSPCRSEHLALHRGCESARSSSVLPWDGGSSAGGGNGCGDVAPAQRRAWGFSSEARRKPWSCSRAATAPGFDVCVLQPPPAAGVYGQASHRSSVAAATTAVGNLPRGPCPVPVASCTNLSRHGGPSPRDPAPLRGAAGDVQIVLRLRVQRDPGWQPRRWPPGTRRRSPGGPCGAAGRAAGPPPPGGNFVSATRRPGCAGSPAGTWSGL